jgi:hypothetical protein
MTVLGVAMQEDDRLAGPVADGRRVGNVESERPVAKALHPVNVSVPASQSGQFCAEFVTKAERSLVSLPLVRDWRQ